MSLLEVQHVKKIYTTHFAGNQVVALKNINFSVEKGEFIAIMGESGSGKTTLLQILAALDKPTEGNVLLNQVDTIHMSDKDLSSFRRNNLGFVFQDFNLLDTFSIRDNIFLPMVLSNYSYSQMEEISAPIVKKLGISHLLDKFPYEVSGGQKQRVAVARALVMKPNLILADEPTGSLDSKSAEELLDLLNEINATGQTIIMVTHSIKAASYASRVMFIKDGNIFHQLFKNSTSKNDMFQKISDTLTVIATGGEQNE